MTSLIGVYECNIDTKGRLLLPVAFKKQMQSILRKGFVVKRSVFHKCLELYSMNEWNDLVKDVNKLNRFKKKNVDFIRIFNAGAKSIELDGSGRILLPKDLLTFAGISKNIVMSAAVNIIEIWDKDRYEKTINDASIDFGSLAEEVMGVMGNKGEDVELP
ncbi:MAG: division/cell wall cluster transcriptional repressor MraZ [Bacteroidetes bacterium]|jgi:MraZ protein|nr:division/cell wall cluster transcriptional repressor MraZ [Bacteroidota bacterium]PHX82186.1 MAG: division/cell wall cluster transcriptional repressor MraZ [Flavobacteriales bacterium]